ncbi:MAG: flagellar basal-body rod protein FlgC [Actinomycetota bacterium]|nr:flagellar basal-body rod protein FlgC [Actinomycetota bacterium]
MAIGALHSAASGVTAGLWSTVVAADSVANASTVRGGSEAPYRAGRVQLAAQPGSGGVTGVGVTRVAGDPAVVHDPQHPLADGRGAVALPAVDVAAEMTQTFLAQRFVQANLVTLRTAAETYRDVVGPAARRVEAVSL